MPLASILSWPAPRFLAVPVSAGTPETHPIRPSCHQRDGVVYGAFYKSVISGFVTGEAHSDQPPPCVVWHRGRTPPFQAARPAPPWCSLSPLSLICLPCPAIITVQETVKEGTTQRSLAAPLWVSRTLGKGREGTAGGWVLAEGHVAMAVQEEHLSHVPGKRRDPATAGSARGAPASA